MLLVSSRILERISEIKAFHQKEIEKCTQEIEKSYRSPHPDPPRPDERYTSYLRDRSAERNIIKGITTIELLIKEEF